MSSLSNLDPPVMSEVEINEEPSNTIEIDTEEVDATSSKTHEVESEAEKKAEIGKCVGFDLEADDPILLEVLSECSENNSPQ